MLGKYLNEHIYHGQVIPTIVFPDELFRFNKDQIIPSAELKDDQIDPMKFGYHDALGEAYTDYKKKSVVDVMRWYIEGTLEKNLKIPTALITRWNIDDPKEFLNDLKWFTKNFQSSFKRAQTCMNIMTHKSAFGYDIQESILPYHEYEQEKVLKEYIQNNMERYKTREEK